MIFDSFPYWSQRSAARIQRASRLTASHNLIPVPAPRKVGHSPQSSTTTYGTWVGRPAVTRWTLKATWAVLGGTGESEGAGLGLAVEGDAGVGGRSALQRRAHPRPTIIIDTADGLTLRLMGWGFEPWWMRNKVKRCPQINARAETLLESPLFRDAAISQPCLIPADGFYEWTGAPGTRTSQPVHVRLKGGELLAFAGI